MTQSAPNNMTDNSRMKLCYGGAFSFCQPDILSTCQKIFLARQRI